jgi:hypothetical protein
MNAPRWASPSTSRAVCGALLVLCGLSPSVSLAADPVASDPVASDPSFAEPPASVPAVTEALPGAPSAAQPAATEPSASAPLSKEAALELSNADSFSNEDPVATEQQRRLELYGFADLTYTKLLIPESNPWNRIYSPSDSFAVGNFNVYLSANLGDNWRALGEVRFLYLPNGATSTDTATGEVKRTDTTVLDYTGFAEPIHWGSVRIERLWVEHEFSTLFKLQVGAFLTPYGIWNVDHGSPAIVGIRAPLAVVNELFPKHQTGIQLYGNAFFDPLEVGYHVTLSNGRGPVEYEDFDKDKAIGGRLYLKTDAVGTLTVGASAYRGGYYDRSAKYVVTDSASVDQEYTTISKYQEFSFGTDLKWQWKRWLVQGEYIMNDASFETHGRPRVDVLKPPQGFQPDYRRWGAYALVGYRTHFLQTMPYAVVQYVYAPNDPVVPPVLGGQVGLNIRPTPAVVLKLELSFTHFDGPGSTGLGNHPLRFVATQVAWAF